MTDFLLHTDIHLWISFIVALIVMIYWMLCKIFSWKKINKMSIIAVIGIPAVMSFSLDSILKNYRTKGDVDYFIKQLEEYADCPYAQDKIGEIRRDLLKFKNKSVETFNAGETISELIRAINKAKTQAVYIDHYILLWNSDFEQLFQANLAAIERRVEIKRVFIITDEILESANKRKQAISIMRRQKNMGIDVRFILQKDLLENDLLYKYYALNNYCLIDNDLIAVTSPASQIQIIPIRSLLVWDDDKMKELNTFQNLLTSRCLKRYEIINNFDFVKN